MSRRRCRQVGHPITGPIRTLPTQSEIEPGQTTVSLLNVTSSFRGHPGHTNLWNVPTERVLAAETPGITPEQHTNDWDGSDGL
jgi:hypothetical protein